MRLLLARPPLITIALVLAGATGISRTASAPIGPDNVGRLGVAWTYDTRESTDPLPGGGKRPAFEATPVYAPPSASREGQDNGVLYLATPRGVVIAVDANTGHERWRVDLEIRKDANYSEFTSRGVTLRGDRLLHRNHRRAARLSRAGSRPALRRFWHVGRRRSDCGVAPGAGYAGEYGVSTPPAIYRDLVIVGSFVADNSRARMASGEVRAFDASSGALRWTFHPLPADAGAGGANTWSSIAVDEANGLVFLPTGSASPDYFGGLRAGQDGHANSIVALRAATGDVAWSFQTVRHDLWDYDVAAPPVLYQGASGPGVAVGSKTGHVFLLERLTGKPISAFASGPCLRATFPASAPRRRNRFPSGHPASSRSVSATAICGVRPPRSWRNAARRSRGCGTLGCSRRRAFRARWLCRATSAACIGAAWPGIPRTGC